MDRHYLDQPRLRRIAAAGLVAGAVLGMAGAFAPSVGLRGLAWGIDGIAIVVGCALLCLDHLRRGDTQIAAGFLVFLAGETLLVSSASADLTGGASAFGGGVGLWSAGLALVSASPAIPRFVRASGWVASMLFAATSMRAFGGAVVTGLSRPLPFFAYPFVAATLVGWAWAHWPRGAQDVAPPASSHAVSAVSEIVA